MVWLYLSTCLLFAGYHIKAWLRTTPPEPGETASIFVNDTKISVLVPAWRAAESLPTFIASFKALSYPNLELILCVGGDDGSLGRAKQFESPNIIVLEQSKGEGKQGGLAKCFAHSTGQVIYLTDIDCVLDDASFAQVVRPVVEGLEEVVTGSSKPVDEQRAVGAVLIHWALVRKAEGFKGRYVSGILGRNCAASRQAVEAIGGFSYAAPTGTDYRMAQVLAAQGYRIWLEPTSEIQTEYAWPLSVYIRKRGRWVRNVLLYAERPRQNAEFFNALSVAFLPLIMLLVLFFSAFATRVLPLSVALLPSLFVLLMIFHGALNRLRYLYETLGKQYLTSKAIGGALMNWLGQLSAGLYALITWLIPGYRQQW